MDCRSCLVVDLWYVCAALYVINLARCVCRNCNTFQLSFSWPSTLYGGFCVLTFFACSLAPIMSCFVWSEPFVSGSSPGASGSWFGPVLTG